jgi:hypothetical protein
MRALATLALLATSILLTPHVASADSDGAKGRIIDLSVNEPASDDYVKFHGSVTLYANKAKTTYHWGGSFCPGKDLSADSVERLTQAFLTRRWTKVTPRFKNGQGGNKCIVGYTLEGGLNDKLD